MSGTNIRPGSGERDDDVAATVEPKPGFAVCRSCDPPRHVPAGEVLAHLTEHHLSVSEIDHAEVTDAAK